MAIGKPVVAIFNGDPVIREALEVLLQAAGYRIRVLQEPVGDELDELLASFHLILVVPELGTERRKVLLDLVSRSAALTDTPVLEVLPEGGTPKVRGGRLVLWPCSIEELERAIDSALLSQE
jgi:hypothetical protein